MWWRSVQEEPSDTWSHQRRRAGWFSRAFECMMPCAAQNLVTWCFCCHFASIFIETVLLISVKTILRCWGNCHSWFPAPPQLCSVTCWQQTQVNTAICLSYSVQLAAGSHHRRREQLKNSEATSCDDKNGIPPAAAAAAAEHTRSIVLIILLIH